MNPALRVEAVDAGSWPRWRLLRREALRESPAAFGSTLAEWSGDGDTEERWRRRLETVPLNLVVVDGGSDVGMVSATDPAGPDGAVELIGIWVSPAVRGRGAGDLAVEAVVRWAGQHHPGAPVKLVVRSANEPARRLYERHGFEAAGLLPDDPTEMLMVRPPGGLPTG